MNEVLPTQESVRPQCQLARQPTANPSHADSALPGRNFSRETRALMMRDHFEPLFTADWDRTLMIHFELDPALLQSSVTFKLDLRDGRAFVSLVLLSLLRFWSL